MERKDYRLAAILYTDIVGFSKMMEKNESKTLELLHVHNGLIEEIVRRRNGSVIKTIGDAFLIDFKNTVDALQSAVEIQESLYEHNKANPEFPLLVRIGVHLGDIYFYENDALGEGINIAARLQSIAHPGCICMSQDVYNLVLNKVDFSAEKLGKVSLKNISKEIRAYEICTPNVEFDITREKGLMSTVTSSDMVIQETNTIKIEKPTDSEDPLKVEDIKRRIMMDIKSAGRRLGADQMRIRYGNEGPEAERVIRELSEKGVLLKEANQKASSPEASADASYRIPKETRYKDIGDEIEDTVREVSQAVRSAVRSAKMERRQVRDQYKHGRDWHGQQWHDRDWKDVPKEYQSASDGISDYERYAKKLRNEARGAFSGFIAHLIPFTAVNGFLMVLNARVSPGFPWALFPFGGWGIGLVDHFASLLRRKDRMRDLEALPPLNNDQLAIFKKIQKGKDGIWHNAASTIPTSAFLFMINAITSSSFWWSLIPIAFMTIGLLSHLGSYAHTKHELDTSLAESFGLSGSGWRKKIKRRAAAFGNRMEDFGNFSDQVNQAIAARDAIVKMVDSGKKNAILVDDELVPILDSYVEQVGLLARRSVEVDRIIETIPARSIQDDRDRLKKKLADNPDVTMKGEYEKSLAEIDKQEQSFQELKNQQELLELKIHSSVNALKQMHIDLARLSGLPEQTDNAVSRRVQEKTQELNRYLDDLRAGYKELERF